MFRYSPECLEGQGFNTERPTVSNVLRIDNKFAA